MIRSFSAAWLSLLLSVPAFADQAPAIMPPDAPSAVNGTQRLWVRPGIDISVAGTRIELGKTTLVELQKTLGGTISKDDSPVGEITFGLCYMTHIGDRRARLWLMSDEDGGADYVIDSALAAPVEAGAPVPANCGELKGPTTVKLGEVTIGSPMADVEARLGKGKKQKGGWLGFRYSGRGGSSGLNQFLFIALGPDRGTLSDLYIAQATAKAGEDDDED